MLYSQNSFIQKIFLDIQILFGWVFIVPFSFLVQKKKGLIIVIGKENGLFSDNTKYFFLYCINNDKSAFFVTEDEKTYQLLLSNKIKNVARYPSIKSIFLLLRAEYLVVDNVRWIKNLKYYFLFKSKKIQLWHGIGSKRIELDNPRFKDAKNQRLNYLKGLLIGTIPFYDYIISTSEYYTKNVYQNAFRYNEIKNFGQPRNDMFFREINNFDLINVDRFVYKQIERKINQKKTIILYTPTFRDTGGNILTDNAFDLNRLDAFCSENNIFFVIKQHPYSSDFPKQHFENVIVYDKYMDIYPLMSVSDIMITDYSSIYLDFILKNKPILFYLYDFEKYKKKDRSLRADFIDITPGQKCYNQKETENEILNIIIKKEDLYKRKREEVLTLSYKIIDGDTSKRIFEVIRHIVH